MNDGTAICPLCGAQVSEEDAAAIEVDMEAESNSCVGCGRIFREARIEEGL